MLGPALMEWDEQWWAEGKVETAGMYQARLRLGENTGQCSEEERIMDSFWR